MVLEEVVVVVVEEVVELVVEVVVVLIVLVVHLFLVLRLEGAVVEEFGVVTRFLVGTIVGVVLHHLRYLPDMKL